MIFRKWGGGGGPKAVWNFSENSSVLVGPPVPKDDNDGDDDYLGPTPGGSLLANGFALSREVGPVAC